MRIFGCHWILYLLVACILWKYLYVVLIFGCYWILFLSVAYILWRDLQVMRIFGCHWILYILVACILWKYLYVVRIFGCYWILYLLVAYILWRDLQVMRIFACHWILSNKVSHIHWINLQEWYCSYFRIDNWVRMLQNNLIPSFLSHLFLLLIFSSLNRFHTQQIYLEILSSSFLFARHPILKIIKLALFMQNIIITLIFLHLICTECFLYLN